MFAFDMSIPPGYLVETEHEARQWMNYFLQSAKARGSLGIDSETTGLVRHRDTVLYWSLSDGQYRICLPKQFIPLFKEPVLENPEVNFDFTNAPFDAHMFANTGADLSKAGVWRDTRIQSWLINENNQGRHGLKDSIKDQFHRETPSFESIFGKVPPKKRDKITGAVISKTVGDLIREVMNDPVRKTAGADYASLDAYNSTTLRWHFDGILKKSKMYDGMTLFDYFNMVDAPFTKVLWKMERRGITVDKGYLLEKQGPMEARMAEIEKVFARHAGRLMNLSSSSPDSKWFFFEVLKYEPIKMTNGGASGNKQPAIDADVLEEWAGMGCQWSKLLLEWRDISKTHGTYVKSLQEHLDDRYRIHTSLNQIGAVTGRLSSSDPNLQNIKRVAEDKFRIREAFIPGFRKKLYVADYEQLEMRLMAHFSGDEKMIDAIWKGVDLHCLTVSEMHGIAYDEVLAAKKAEKAVKEGKRDGLTEREEELLFMRQAAKATGFGIIYGIGGPKLAANLTKMGNRIVTEEEGWRSIKKWFGVFPRVEQFIEETKAELWRSGKVQTIMGRWRRFGDLKGMSKRDAAQCERQAVNSIVQGSAADVAKMAMIQAEYDPELNKLGVQMLLQVHDELIFEGPDDVETEKSAKRRITEIMKSPFGANQPLKVPLPAEAGSGYSWADAK